MKLVFFSLNSNYSVSTARIIFAHCWWKRCKRWWCALPMLFAIEQKTLLWLFGDFKGMDRNRFTLYCRTIGKQSWSVGWNNRFEKRRNLLQSRQAHRTRRLQHTCIRQRHRSRSSSRCDSIQWKSPTNRIVARWSTRRCWPYTYRLGSSERKCGIYLCLNILITSFQILLYQ